jgi:hypothetical protein
MNTTKMKGMVDGSFGLGSLKAEDRKRTGKDLLSSNA